MNIVPMTAKEDAELLAEPNAGELGLCGTGDNACAPKCCMTREEAAADAAREFTAIKIDPDGGLKLDEPYRPMVDIAEPGWAPKMAEMLGGAHMSILLEAEGIINGARRGAYGTAEKNFERIQLLWNAYLLGKPGGPLPITEQDTALMVLLVKVARLLESPRHRDSLVDIAGYAGCIETLWTDQDAKIARLADEL